MANQAALKALKIIREESPLGDKSLPQLRKNFEKFYLRFSSHLELQVEEISMEGVPGVWISASNINKEKIILFFHGGGFTIGSSRDHQDLCGKLSAAARARVLSVDYRLAPENHFPAAVEDCLSSYRWLLKQGSEAKNIVPTGISAGGTLVLTTLLQARDEGLSLPAAAVCMSPAVDLTFPGKTVQTNRENDWISQPRLDGLRNAYLSGQDPSNPLASPIHANLKGLPPLLLQVGTHELLLDDITAFYNKAKKAGVDATLEPWKEMFHCWQVFSSIIPDGQKAIESAGKFTNQVTGYFRE